MGGWQITEIKEDKNQEIDIWRGWVKKEKQDMFGTFEVNKTKLEWSRLSEKSHGKVKNVLFYFTKSPDNNMHDSSKILSYLDNFSIRLPLRIQVIMNY